MPTSLSRVWPILLVASLTLLLFWLGLTQAMLFAQPLRAQELPSQQTTQQQTLNTVQARVNVSRLFTFSNILLTTTVGTDSGSCATGDTVIVSAGNRVYYCYAVRNASDYTLTRQTIAGSAYGFVMENAALTLTPSAEGFLTVTAIVARTTPNTNTWTATATNGIVLQAVDATTVLVPEISLSVTVGINPHVCSSDTVINASLGTEVIYCYRVWNRGEIPYTYHQIRSEQFGALVDSRTLTEPLAPGESAFVTVTSIVTRSTTNVATWTAFLTQTIAATATNVAQVHVPTISLSTTVAPGHILCTDPKIERFVVITVTSGTLVTFCYWATNTGGVPLAHHVVADKVVQRPSTAFTLTMNEGESIVVSATTNLTQTLVNSVTWLSKNDQGLWATASQTATVHIAPPTWIEAFVFYDVNGNGHFDEGEPGLADVPVELRPSISRAPWATDTITKVTNSEGLAPFVDLTPGIYNALVEPTILAEGEAYTLTTHSAQVAITLSRGEKQDVRFGYVTRMDKDTDGDGVWDRIEGAEDHNGDGKPDFNDGLPGGLLLFLPVLAR